MVFYHIEILSCKYISHSCPPAKLHLVLFIIFRFKPSPDGIYDNLISYRGGDVLTMHFKQNQPSLEQQILFQILPIIHPCHLKTALQAALSGRDSFSFFVTYMFNFALPSPLFAILSQVKGLHLHDTFKAFYFEHLCLKCPYCCFTQFVVFLNLFK